MTSVKGDCPGTRRPQWSCTLAPASRLDLGRAAAGLRVVLFAALMVLVAAPSAAVARSTALAPASVLAQRGSGPALAFEPSSATGLAVYNALGGFGGPVSARRITSRGRPLGPPVVLQPRHGSAEPSLVDVSYNGQRREYLAVWLEGPRASTTKTLRGQRISALGAPVGAQLTLGEEPVSAFSPPSVAASERTGSYAVAIKSLDGTVGVRVFDGEGGLVSEGAVSQARSNGCGFPDVAYRGRSDEYLIGFACGLPAEAGQPPQTQYVQRLSSTGVEIGPDVPVITPRYTNFGRGELALAYNARLDQFLFVGQGRRRMRTRRLDGSGTPIGPVRTLRRVNAGGEVSSSVVGFDPRTKRYLVAWSGNEPRGRNDPVNAVFSTRVGERGVERGPEALRRGEFISPSSIIARGNAGGFLVGLSDEPRTLVRFLSR